MQNRSVSPFLISLASLDSFPPGEAMALPRQLDKYQFTLLLRQTDMHILLYLLSILGAIPFCIRLFRILNAYCF